MTHFVALIPARMASTRLPNKPLAEIAGVPMVVRVAQQAQKSGAQRVVVAADDERVVAACAAHQIEAVLTDGQHPTGTDRLAQAAALLKLAPTEIVVNVQGDEPLIAPELIRAVAEQLAADADSAMATAAHEITEVADFFNPNVVKVVCNARQQALYFSRAPIAWPRDVLTGITAENYAHLPQTTLNATAHKPLRHIGIYAYRASFLKIFPTLAVTELEKIEALEQLRALWHGYAISVLRTQTSPHAGVDTPEDLERVRRFFGT